MMDTSHNSERCQGTAVELVTRRMELKKQQARAPKKQSPSALQLLDQRLAITDGQVADG
jgi:hypothetical protein